MCSTHCLRVAKKETGAKRFDYFGSRKHFFILRYFEAKEQKYLQFGAILQERFLSFDLSFNFFKTQLATPCIPWIDRPMVVL